MERTEDEEQKDLVRLCIVEGSPKKEGGHWFGYLSKDLDRSDLKNLIGEEKFEKGEYVFPYTNCQEPWFDQDFDTPYEVSQPIESLNLQALVISYLISDNKLESYLAIDMVATKMLRKAQVLNKVYFIMNEFLHMYNTHLSIADMSKRVVSRNRVDISNARDMASKV